MLLTTGIQLKQVLRFILLACVLMSANAFACEPGEKIDSHNHAAQRFDIVQAQSTTEPVSKSLSAVNPSQTKAVGLPHCKCCDSCQCASCTGCLGGCNAMTIPTLFEESITVVYPLDRFESLPTRYISPLLPTTEYPPRHPMAGISC